MNKTIKFLISVALLVFITLFCSCGLKTSTKVDKSNAKGISERRYPLWQLQKDYKQFQNTIQRKHPKLYTNKKELSELFETQYSLLEENMGELDFYRILSPIASKLNCGHTILSVSKEYENYLAENGRYLPLIIKVIGNGTYITQDFSSAGIPEGSEVISINGRPMEDIIRILLDNLPADGYNLTKKYYIINHWFNGIYYNYVDNSESFDVAYKKPGNDEIIKVTLPSIKNAQMNMTAMSIYIDRDDTPLYSKTFGNNYAVLKIKTFDLDEYEKYKVFIDEFFKELSDKKISNLILDLRDNWGGAPEYTSYLYSYLISEASPYMSKDAPFYYFSLKRPVKPAPNHYNGKLYTLINGASFSSTGHLCSLLKFHNIGTFIGEESGGSFACTDGAIDTTLKYTGLRLHCSTTVFKTAVSGLVQGRGIMPDYAVVPNLKDYLDKNDPEMNLAMELIKKQ